MKVSLYALMDNVIKPVVGDLASRALAFIDSYHHEIHEGKAYSLAGTVTLPAGGVYEFFIQTPDTDEVLHLEDLHAQSDGSLQVDLYMDSSKTDVSGNRIVPVNRNFNSSNTTNATVCHTPGGSGDGTLKYSKAVAADHPLDEGASLSAASGRKEFLLKKNSVHLIRFTGGNNDVVAYDIEWYEHEPGEDY